MLTHCLPCVTHIACHVSMHIDTWLAMYFDTCLAMCHLTLIASKNVKFLLSQNSTKFVWVTRFHMTNPVVRFVSLFRYRRFLGFQHLLYRQITVLPFFRKFQIFSGFTVFFFQNKVFFLVFFQLKAKLPKQRFFFVFFPTDSKTYLFFFKPGTYQTFQSKGFFFFPMERKTFFLFIYFC